MPSYYEILNVSPSATTGEIETALDSFYNHWRRLVTHTDQAVMSQANHNLQILEQIRATLTDPIQRSTYDFSLNSGGTSAGLTDPSAASLPIQGPVGFTPSPSKPSVAQPPPNAVQRLDAWMCPKCQAANLIGTRFCKSCGQALSRNCPKCGQAIEAKAEYCSECGVNILSYERELQQQEELRQQELQARQKKLQEAARLKAALGPIIAWADQASLAGGLAIGISWMGVLSACLVWYCALIPIMIAALPAGWGLYRGIRVLRSTQQEGSAPYRRKAWWGVGASVISLAIAGAALALTLLSVVVLMINSGGRR